MERTDVGKEAEITREVEIAKDAQMRANNCMVDIKNALKKWNCQIDPILQFSGQGIQRSYAVIPLVKRPLQ